MGVVMVGGEARAKGEMSGWRMMRGNRAAEDATGGEGRTTRSDWEAEDTTRGGGT